MLQSQQSQSHTEFNLHWAFLLFSGKKSILWLYIDLPMNNPKVVLSAEPGGNFIRTHHILFEFHIQFGV